MSDSRIVNFIQTVPLFHSLTSDQIGALVHDMEERTFEPDEIVIGPDSDFKELFIVLEGEFALTRHLTDINVQRELARLYPGDYFGILLVIASSKADAVARAVTPAKALVLSQEAFDRLFTDAPGFARAVCQSLAQYVKGSIRNMATVPFAQLHSFPDLKNHIGLIPSRICHLCECLPVEHDGDRVTVAMVDPNNTRNREFVTHVLQEYAVDFVAISDDDFQQHATMLLKTEVRTLPPDTPFNQLELIDASGQSSPIRLSTTDDLLPLTVTKAIRVDASDIHIEPTSSGGRIRLRVDGRMAVVEDKITAEKFHHFTNRLKVFAELDTTNIRRPQDGRFMIVADDRRVEFRVSVTPCLGGEKVVLRIVAPHANLGHLDHLIPNETAFDFAHDILESPSGLVLVTGPTGSGKTTTLYAALRMIESRDHTLNIVTIEDPVEYNLDFATQIQVNNSLELGFSKILRTVLRQDPDVILVGEIRDPESANIAVDAATTGHLVLSSLHTDSALDSLVRLRNLGVKPYLLASALKGVISQKLVPRLSPDQTQTIGPDEEIVHRMKRLGVLESDWQGPLYRGVDESGGPAGGESGRVGVFEILSMTDTLRDLIDQQGSLSQFEDELNENCFCSFANYSRFLITNGLVSPERIDRIFPKQN